MKKQAAIAAAIGFLVPIFWGIAGFILFNLPESTFSNFFWRLVYITCPFWLLPGIAGMLAMPFLNGALYAVLWLLISRTLIQPMRG